MILSKKGRYGLRALIDLAANSKDQHMALNYIAERNGISAQYLEQVFAALRRADIVKSIKGPQGGYLLKREPDDISVAEIVLALDGTYHVDDEAAQANSDEQQITDTVQRMIVDQINDRLDEVLAGITLADLEADYLAHRLEEQDMYYI